MEFVHNQSPDADERISSVIQVARMDRHQDAAFPLARLYTCGPLTIEVLHTVIQGRDGRMEAIYGPVDATLLTRKGSSAAFVLLALLASQPGYFASKDWLSEKLGHWHEGASESDEEEEEEGTGLKRVDNVVSRLRHLLSPPRAAESREEQLLRRRLVAYQRASSEKRAGVPTCRITAALARCRGNQ